MPYLDAVVAVDAPLLLFLLFFPYHFYVNEKKHTEIFLIAYAGYSKNNKEFFLFLILFICVINFFSVLHTFFIPEIFLLLAIFLFKLNFFCIAAQTFIIFTKSTLTGAAYFLYFILISLLFYYFLYINFFLYLCLDDGGCFWWELIFIDAQFFWCSKISLQNFFNNFYFTKKCWRFFFCFKFSTFKNILILNISLQKLLFDKVKL